MIPSPCRQSQQQIQHFSRWAEGLPQCHGSMQRALSPQMDASSAILCYTSIHHMPPGWESHHGSFPSGSPGVGEQAEVLPQAVGAHRLETPGHNITQLSQQMEDLVDAMGSDGGCLAPCNPPLKHVMAALPLSSLLFKPCWLRHSSARPHSPS